ncbi:NAD(P)H-dependent oxidoreductase [Deefgea piscis]|uniref:NAD(P)H-dependent oxidoreductase n=1 Tax=Deefgea piscis TaxID=2739061 RepID=A0A6M8SU49_9NEIS|nr:NADPH-dependent FMN reductase [Deefgea piscis]QKJ65387.1 NAD(P)H-dependent oxidoreductase [Deefgea piscis]
MNKNIKLVAISGSLRAASCNSALLRAVKAMAPIHIQVSLFEQMAFIPPFNPDINIDEFPLLAQLRDQIIAADGVLIASPEYAHGISGVMKNLLDWMVNTPAFVNKPVAILNAAPRAHHAFDSLKEVLTMMSANLLYEASITVPVIGEIKTTEAILRTPLICMDILKSLASFSEFDQATID